jgi:hypothetical protein
LQFATEETVVLSPIGAAAILAQDPEHRPASLARSPAPRVQAATKAAC